MWSRPMCSSSPPAGSGWPTVRRRGATLQTASSAEERQRLVWRNRSSNRQSAVPAMMVKPRLQVNHAPPVWASNGCAPQRNAHQLHSLFSQCAMAAMFLACTRAATKLLTLVRLTHCRPLQP